MQHLPSLILTAALMATPGIADSGGKDFHSHCNSTPFLHEVLVARDGAHQRHLARQRADGTVLEKAGPVTVTRQGEIAVLEADDELVIPANPFDLEGRAIRFVPRGSGYAVGREKGGFHRPVGKKVDIRAFDSVRVDFDHGATFPFGGEVHSGMWINSTGHLTFNRGDRNPAQRLEALVGNLPRIAPMIQSFNPVAARGKGGIYYWVDRETREIRVTWFKVPILPTIANRTATFQVRLQTNGRITFAYEKIGTGDGLIGIFPPTDGVQVLDFRRELPAPARGGAIAEEFFQVPQIDHTALSRAFYEHFEDEYDQIVTWYDFDLDVSFFFSAPVRNEIQGIGLPSFDASQTWVGRPGGQLKTYLFMNSLDFIPDDPDGPAFAGSDNSPSAIEVLGHEVGHRWGSFPRILDPRTGEESDVLLGRQLAHWNFNLDTDASVMQGNDIGDNGDGTFTTLDAWVGYSALDLYLMGFVPASAVPPFFFVDGADNPPREASPRIGVDLAGERVDVTIDDILAVEGERIPASDAAPRDFRAAFVLVTLPGEAPRDGSVAKLDTYRLRWEEWWAEATAFDGTFDTTLSDGR